MSGHTMPVAVKQFAVPLCTAVAIGCCWFAWPAIVHAQAKAGSADNAQAPPPKAESPKSDAPKAEAPKTDAPKSDVPKSDAPKADAAKPTGSGRLFEQSPYDQITLTAEQGGSVLKVLPLNLPMRKVPEKPRPSDKLPVHLVEEPDQEYEIEWYHIAEVKLFEQLILDEANRLVSEAKFDEAYAYFDYLRREHPSLAGVHEGIANYLYEEAKDSQRQSRYDGALNLLNTLFEHDPKFPGLENALGAATGKLVERHIAKGDFASARRLVYSLKERIPSSPSAAAWEERLSQQAADMLANAKSDQDAGRMAEAQDAARQALTIWPPLAGAREFLTAAFAKYPRVAVGVTTRVAEQSSGDLIDWAARRTNRLEKRRLLEFTGYGPEGGIYVCPLGTIETAELGRRLVFQLQPPRNGSAGDAPSGYDIARGLFALAQPGHSSFRAEWADLFGAVEVHDVYRVEVDLRRSHVRPIAVLAAAASFNPGAPADEQPLNLSGPYVAKQAAGDASRFVGNPRYSSATATREIVERYYANGREALQALLKGDVSVLDRINPWDVDALAAHKELVVEPYGVPSVHCLLPNLNRPFPAHRAFRRGIAYGIHRAAILDNQLLRGRPLAGCTVVSGPFAIGAGLNDPAGYAYSDEVAPRGYEPRLAVALTAVALNDIQAAAKQRGQEIAQIPPLVLAHPAHDVARIACKTIAKQLGAIGLTINLREIAPGDPLALAPGDDFLYVELTLDEPLVDARRLLAADGLVGGASPYMSQALRHVDAAESWKEASAALREVHRIAHDDEALVPLWQLTEHLAYHQSLRGVGKRPATLYQRVEQWQGGLRLPGEAP